jgi:hypothetical protein
MSIRSFAVQLSVRLTLIAGLLATVGASSYAATHWYPTTSGAETSGPGPTTVH